jgi:sarcosine oxidase subunit alpha
VSFSPTLHRTIGLAFVKPSLAAPGTRIRFRLTDGRMVAATVVPIPFYDPENLRQKDAASSKPAALKKETA